MTAGHVKEHFMKRQTRASTLGILAVVMALSTTAWAGSRSGFNVSITISGDTGAAAGAMGYVRNSADTLQYIGCTVTTSLTSTFTEVARTLTCSARNVSNVTVACSSTDINLIETAYSIGSDSYVRFEWDAGGNCTSLRIGNYSQYAPK